MTKRRFAIGLACAAILLSSSSAFAGRAQRPEAPLKAGRPIKAGDVLSGELNALRLRDAKLSKRVATYQITTEPRRLPPPNGLCNLETGPETFQLVTTGDAQAGQLKALRSRLPVPRMRDR